MLVTTLTTAYLVAPAMFTDVSDLSYISPLTLAVKMYRNEPFGWREYLFPSLPMAAIFGFAMFAGTRLLNEEFLIGYKPITRKIGDAIYLLMSHAKLYLSVPLWSVLVVPIVYMAQIIFLAFASNLPLRHDLGGHIAGFGFDGGGGQIRWHCHAGGTWQDQVRIVKSFGIAFLSAMGFFVGEKLLVLVSIGMVSQASISSVLFGAGFVPVRAADRSFHLYHDRHPAKSKNKIASIWQP